MDGHKFPIGLSLGVLWVVTCCAQPPSRDRGSEIHGVLDNISRSTPHPWLSIAPGEFLRLINRGSVQIQANDELLASYGKAALTRFELKLDYKCIYAPPKPASTNRPSVLLLDVRYTKRDLQVLHSIVIPNDYSPKDPWKDRLMKHEMDHVAITTDPRLQAMVNGVFSRGFRIEIERLSNESLTPTEYQSSIDQFTKKCLTEIESLLQFQYDELDRVSRDGYEDLEDRRAFFQSLYDYETCRKHLSVTLRGVNQDLWDRWVRIDSKKLAAHYSLSR